jgi:LysR family malonate utilization transcriptional regulator
MVSFVRAGLGFALLPGRMQPVFESTVKLITLAEPYRIRQTIGIVFKKTHEHEANFLALAAEARMYGRSRFGTPLPLPLPLPH